MIFLKFVMLGGLKNLQVYTFRIMVAELVVACAHGMTRHGLASTHVCWSVLVFPSRKILNDVILDAPEVTRQI